MKRDVQLLPIALIMILSSVMVRPILAQSESSSRSTALLEIAYLGCSDGTFCEDSKTRVYADGRYISESLYPEKAKSGRYRQVSTREEKRLEAEELAELIGWAEQPDFLSARPEYYVARVHHGHGFTILYRNKGREQKVSVINYRHGSEAQRTEVPPSVLKLLRWENPYYFERAEQGKN